MGLSVAFTRKNLGVSPVAKENQRVMVTKRLLKDGLFRLLEQKNIDKVNVTELCKESGINRATFYAHYGTPYDVLTEIEHKMIDEIMRETERLWKQRGSLDFRVSTEIMCQYFYDHADVLRVLLRNFSGQDFARMLNQTYQKILDSSILKDADKDNIKLMTAYLAGGGIFLLSTWLSEDIQKSPQETARLIASMFSDSAILK